MSLQIFYPYWLWEDYLNGMYETEISEDRVLLSISLLSSDTLLNVMLRVISEWPCTTDHNMTAKGNNKQSWLGQCACSINHKGTELETRQAWSKLTDEQRKIANEIADMVIKEYEEKTTGVRANLGTKRIFRRYTGRSTDKVGATKQSAIVPENMFSDSEK